MKTQERIRDIQKDIVLSASKDRVWDALTTKEGWTAWFSYTVEGDFKVGSVLKMGFSDMEFCYGKVTERVEGKKFSYQWHPGEPGPIDKYPETEMTTVTFELEEMAPNRTKLTVTESGLENLPNFRYISAVEMNSGGWDACIGSLQTYVEKDERQIMKWGRIANAWVFAMSPEEIWPLLGESSGWKKWFLDTHGAEFVEGAETPVELCEGKMGKIMVEKLVPNETFQYRWIPGGETEVAGGGYPIDKTTEVTFSVSACPSGAMVVVSEKGFENLPKESGAKAYEDHFNGWGVYFDRLKAVVQE